MARWLVRIYAPGHLLSSLFPSFALQAQPWGSFDSVVCDLAFGFHAAPAIEADLLDACRRGHQAETRGGISALREGFLLEQSFFVPFEPQWVQTVSLAGSLYEGALPLLTTGKVEILATPEKTGKAPLVFHHFMIRYPANRGFSPGENLSSLDHPILTEFKAMQLVPFSRDDYLVTEVLRRGTRVVGNLKRMIFIRATPGGSWIRHLLVLQFISEDVAARLSLEVEIFNRQTARIRQQIQEDLGPLFFSTDVKEGAALGH